MTFKKFQASNNAETTLAVLTNASATTIICKTGEWDLYPTHNGSSDKDYPLVLRQYNVDWYFIKQEIVLVTARSWNTFTITRSYGTCVQDETANPKVQWSSARSFEIDDSMALYFTAENQEDLNDEVERLETDKAEDDEVVKITWNQTIAWIKTFDSIPVWPWTTPTADAQLVDKWYTDTIAFWVLYWTGEDWALNITSWTTNITQWTYNYTSVNISSWAILSMVNSDTKWDIIIKCQWTCNIEWNIDLSWKLFWEENYKRNIILWNLILKQWTQGKWWDWWDWSFDSPAIPWYWWVWSDTWYWWGGWGWSADHWFSWYTPWWNWGVSAWWWGQADDDGKWWNGWAWWYPAWNWWSGGSNWTAWWDAYWDDWVTYTWPDYYPTWTWWWWWWERGDLWCSIIIIAKTFTWTWTIINSWWTWWNGWNWWDITSPNYWETWWWWWAGAGWCWWIIWLVWWINIFSWTLVSNWWSAGAVWAWWVWWVGNSWTVAGTSWWWDIKNILTKDLLLI